jgi:NYN domain/OST-HTH/LOTUS domain
MELAYERGFVSTFVICSGDSDFTPLVAALRALNRRVIGIGVKGSTSSLLPPACDEFLFYDRLPGVGELAQQGGRRTGNGGNGGGGAARPPRRTSKPRKDDGAPPAGQRDLQELQRQLTQTLAGLKQSGAEPVLASSLKRALLRKDPTFAESDYGFRAFRELLAQAERNGIVSLTEGQAPGDPAVDFPDSGQADKAFELLRQTLRELQGDDEEVPLSGLKDQMRKRDPRWSEKDFGYSGFLQFVKAAAAKGIVNMEWDDAEGDYFLYVPD